jgi:hypothetical protein
MSTISFSVRYRVAMSECGRRCPIEAGLLGRLADNECHHGRLPFDRTPPCGCWPQEGATLHTLPHPHEAAREERRAA